VTTVKPVAVPNEFGDGGGVELAGSWQIVHLENLAHGLSQDKRIRQLFRCFIGIRLRIITLTLGL
jgi:hypothetical protein